MGYLGVMGLPIIYSDHMGVCPLIKLVRQSPAQKFYFSVFGVPHKGSQEQADSIRNETIVLLLLAHNSGHLVTKNRYQIPGKTQVGQG